MLDGFLSSMENATDRMDEIVGATRARSDRLVHEGPRQCKLLLMESFLLLAYRNLQRATDGDGQTHMLTELKQLCLSENMFCVNNTLHISLADLHASVQTLVQDHTS